MWDIMRRKRSEEIGTEGGEDLENSEDAEYTFHANNTIVHSLNLLPSVAFRHPSVSVTSLIAITNHTCFPLYVL